METIISIITFAGFASMIFRRYKINLVDNSSLVGFINEGTLDLGNIESRLKVIMDNFFIEINVNPQFVEQRNTSKWITDLSEMIRTGDLSPEHTEAALKALKEICLLLP